MSQEGTLFPLPKEHWMPHSGVKNCMICNQAFVKSLFGGSGKDNCRKCGRVVCKQYCLRHKISDYKVCKECYQNRNDQRVNEEFISNLIAPDGTTLSPKSQKSPSNNHISQTRNLYEQGMKNIENEKIKTNNPYLSEKMIKQYERQINMRIGSPMQLDPARTRSHSADVSTTSTVPVPHSLLDLTTDIPLPANNVPSPNIISPLLKEEDEYEDESRSDDMEDEYKLFEIKETSDPIKTPRQRKSIPFRARKPPKKAPPPSLNKYVDHNRESSASVGNIRLSGHYKSKSKSPTSPSSPSSQSKLNNGPYMIKRKSITVMKWVDDDSFDIDEKGMKLYEDKTYTETKIKNTQPMIIRLDGFGFGMFTNKMDKPFDYRFHSAMINTSCDLLKEYECYTVFTQSDEIVMIYPTTHHRVKGTYLFSGKIAKILSVVSSFASCRLSYHLRKESWINDMENQRNINNASISFNTKCFNLSNGNDEIFDYIIWRLKKNIRGYKKILTVANEFSHGCYIKKEKYIHPKKNKQRERITSCCVQIESRERKYHQLLQEKYWKNAFLQQMQNNQRGYDEKKQDDNGKEKGKAKGKGNRLSFDDEDIYPDIYNTMLVHDGNNENINQVPVPPPNPYEQQKTPIPKPKPKPKRPQSSKAATKSHRPDYNGNNIITNTNINNNNNSKYSIVPKRKSLPVGKQKDIYSLANRVAAESVARKKKKTTNNVYIPPANPNLYETMIIHDMNDINIDPAKTMTVRDFKDVNATSSSPSPCKPKPEKRRYSKYATKPKSRSPVPKRPPPRPISPQRPISPMNAKPKPMAPPKPKSRSPRPRPRPRPKSMTKSKALPQPASANPNYKYNFAINVNRKSLSSIDDNTDNKKRVSPEPMSAKDRIRMMNARLQNMQQQT